MPTFRRPPPRAAKTGVQGPRGRRAPDRPVAEQIRAELDLLGAPRSPLRGADVEPMLAETAERAFSRKGWLFELKIDGFRAIASRRGEAVALHYRRGRDATALYPDLARALAALPASDLVLDGEIAVLDGKGLPSFQLLQRRALLSQPFDVAKAASTAPATYFAFDLLGFEDRDLRSLPLAERKRLLAMLLPRRGPVCAVEHVEEQGEELFERVVAAGLEGVMGKQADAPYTPGRSPRWLKVRRLRTADFAIVAFTGPGGTRGGFGALHLALGTDDGLLYAGRVGSGFGERQLRDLRERLEPLRVPAPPCGGPVPRGPGNVWVRPQMVCEARYHPGTAEGLLRHAVFLRLRDDKSEPDAAPPSVQISNPRKLLWPEDGIAKGELVDYYRAIAPRMLPYLRDRALTLTRYPDGISGKFFFQKKAPAHTPGWVRKERIAEAGTWDRDKRRERWGPGSARKNEGPIDAVVCDDEATLVWCANLAAIPLHVPANRIADPAHCDYCVVDLDPKEAPFAHVVEVALALRELCQSIGLPSFVKTSGQKGLHVLLPLGGACTPDGWRAAGGW